MIAAQPRPDGARHGRERHRQAGRSRACCTTDRRAPAGPFVELNCSAIPETLVESELFGHERGAFSDARERKLGLVEIADGGTLFLDEIGDLGLGGPGQAADLPGAADLPPGGVDLGAAGGRARRRGDEPRSQEHGRRPHAARGSLLSARRHHRSPARRCASGPEDIPALAAHFLQVAAREFGRRFAGIAPEALGLLSAYRWPGNVRELRAVINRAVLMHDDELLRAAHLPPELVAAALSAPPAPPRAPERRRVARRDPDAGRDRAGPYPARARHLSRQPHARRAAPRHHPPDLGETHRIRGRRIVGRRLRPSA